MRKVEQIEQQIRELSAGEFSELREWVLEQDWKAWDAQVESDVRSGKLDKVIAEADADYKAGRTRPLGRISRRRSSGRSTRRCRQRLELLPIRITPSSRTIRSIHHFISKRSVHYGLREWETNIGHSARMLKAACSGFGSARMRNMTDWSANNRLERSRGWCLR